MLFLIVVDAADAPDACDAPDAWYMYLAEPLLREKRCMHDLLRHPIYLSPLSLSLSWLSLSLFLSLSPSLSFMVCPRVWAKPICAVIRTVPGYAQRCTPVYATGYDRSVSPAILQGMHHDMHRSSSCCKLNRAGVCAKMYTKSKVCSLAMSLSLSPSLVLTRYAPMHQSMNCARVCTREV